MTQTTGHARLLAVLLAAGMAVAAVAAGAGSPRAARGDVTPDQVAVAINNAINRIKKSQNADGSWQDYGRRGGLTALNLLALLNAGVPESDAVIRKGIAALDKAPNSDTYVVALKCMVYRYADPKKYHKQLAAAAQWLIEAQLDSGTWGYNKMGNNVRNYVGDNSNTQFALLGLHEASMGGIDVPREVWARSEKHFVNSQSTRRGLGQGSWHYRPMGDNRAINGYGSMTCAGLASLYITGNELNVSQEKGYVGGTASNCGNYRQNEAIAMGLTWLDRNFAVDRHPFGSPSWHYYYLYAMERVGMISGVKAFGQHDWYRRGAEFLIGNQKNGDWGSPLNNSFALLFLAKGNKPVLINKLRWTLHDTAWNEDRNDANHLVNWLTDAKNEKDVEFTDQPLGWQVVNMQAPLVDLLDAPILYFNGHTFPKFTKAEQDKLREFVDQGGTILAEACCSRQEFVDGFDSFAKEVWPEYGVGELPDDHPIFTSFYDLGKNEWGLKGIQVGCRTSVIFAPRDLSCLWEQMDPKLEQTEAALRVGANVAAYATGLERLKDKLQRARVAEGEEAGGQPGDIVRGAVHIAVLAHGKNPMENMPDPNALPKFHEYLRDQAKIDVVTRLKVIEATDVELLNHPIVYMTGHNGFEMGEVEVKALKTWLDRGGFLFANACCGRDNVNYNLPGDRNLTNDFGTSFRKLCKQLYPEASLTELGPEHPIRGRAEGYFPLDRVTYRPQLEKKLTAVDAAHAHDLHVEGVEVDGRLVIAYSRYALTCGLEDHKCFGCRGLVTKDAYRLSTNVILHALTH